MFDKLVYCTIQIKQSTLSVQIFAPTNFRANKFSRQFIFFEKEWIFPTFQHACAIIQEINLQTNIWNTC